MHQPEEDLWALSALLNVTDSPAGVALANLSVVRPYGMAALLCQQSILATKCQRTLYPEYFKRGW